MANAHISEPGLAAPLGTVHLGLVEQWPESVQVGAKQWRPVWGFQPLWAFDGRLHWDLRRPDVVAGLQHHLRSADRVVVNNVPYAFADWSVPWWPVQVHERALTLGGPDAEDDLGNLLMRYQNGIGDPGLRWSPSGWPFPPEVMPPETYLRDQAVAYQRVLAGIHAHQASRTVTDLLRELDTITMPCDRVHARLCKEGISWTRERGIRLMQEIDGEIESLRAALAKDHQLTDPLDDGFVWVWLMMRGISNLFPDGVDNDLLKEYDKCHPAFKPLRRCRRLVDFRRQSWPTGMQIGPDGRFHPFYRTLHAPTSRSTTLGPALDSTPKEIRARILTPEDPAWAYDDCDFSGHELFVAAVVSGDAGLAACCRTGKPVAAIAQHIFPELASVPVLAIEDLYKPLYDLAKGIGYGSIFEQHKVGLSKKLNIPEHAAQSLLNRLHAICPNVLRRTRAMQSIGWRTGRLPIGNGLERHLQPADFAEKGRVDRLAANTWVQGAAASEFRAVTVVGDALIRQYGGALVLPLHDGLHYIGPRAAMPELAPAFQAKMGDTFAKVFDTDLVPPVSSAWLKQRAAASKRINSERTTP